MKIALITGITGQDGSYLAEVLLEKGYIVYGLVRRSSCDNLERIKHLCEDPSLKSRFFIEEGDLSDGLSLKRIFDLASPDEVYNLGAMSHVKSSFSIPEYTADIGALGVVRLLEVIRCTNPKVKFYQASTSELFGKVRETPQKETTPFYPRSPYGLAKQYAYWAVINYRESYNLFASNGILFNHESPRRGENFVSRKVTLGVAKIKKGLQDKLFLGNLDAQRDWGYAKDFVEGMWMMLQHDTPDDFVLATGKKMSVRNFVKLAFQEVDIELKWDGEGLNEKGIDSRTGKVLVEVSEEHFRPCEVDYLIGDASKAEQILGWKPKTTTEQLIKMMVKSDLQLLESAPSVAFARA
jgi:GDPmannose 4,6-dehydratase